VLLFTGKRDILFALAARIGRDLRGTRNASDADREEDFRFCGPRRARASGPGAGMAEAKAHAVHRRLRPGKHDRYRRAPGRSEAGRVAGTVRGGGEQAGRGRQHRCPVRQARRARRLHGARDQRRLRRQPQPVRERRIRSLEGLRAGRPGTQHAQYHHGAPVREGEQSRGTDRARPEGEARVCLIGHRHDHAPFDGAHQDRDGGGHHPCALPAGAGRDGCGRGTDADLEHLHAACGAADQGRR